MFDFFKKPPLQFLGIDIGTAGIKVVQLGMEGGKIKLENYASLETGDYLEVSNGGARMGGGRAGTLIMSEDKIVNDLKSIIKESKMTATKAALSIPVSSAFSSVMSLPDIPDSEIPRAVSFEARQYIPIPINEVVFGWNIIGREEDNKISSLNSSKQMKKVKVLLVAIPNETISKYTDIVKMLNLELVAIETESFALTRAIVGQEKGTFNIVDIGSKETSMTIVENGSVIMSHSISGTGGEEITRAISFGMGLDLGRAEDLKKDIGLKFSATEKKVSEIMLPVISIIISEIKKINETYVRNSRKTVDKVIVTGGTAELPGLIDYISKELNVKVEICNPWKNIVYKEILSERLKKMSSSYAIAVGLALRGFEK